MKEFDRIIGYGRIKNELERIADSLKNTELYRKSGIDAPHGLLLYGEPGVGKSLMADCLVKASGRPVFVCRKNEPDGDFIRHIREVFSEAAENAPSVILLDDIDKFANDDFEHRNAEEYVTVQTCIDEFRDSGIFVLATANDIRKLPHSLIRAGRFDRRINVPRPKGDDAAEIIKHHIEGCAIEFSFESGFAARLLSGHSCAMIKNVLNESGAAACYERNGTVSEDNFIRAYVRTTSGGEITTDFSEEAKKHICMHEAGHAAVSELLSPGSITLVYIAENSEGPEGAAVTYKNCDYLPAESMTEKIKISLAGTAANEVLRGSFDTGGSADIFKAFDIANDYVDESGVLGLGYYGLEFCETAYQKQNRENAVRAEVLRLRGEVKNLIVKNRAFVEAIADGLFEKGYLTQDGISEIRNKIYGGQADIEKADKK